MAFDPVFNVWAGMLPIMNAAKRIIEDDFSAALAWRCALDSSTAGADYVRVQFSQAHSQNYPMLVIQPAQSIPDLLGTGGIQQRHVFDVEIFLTRAISGGIVDGINELSSDLVRYYDATVMAFLSATGAQWTASLPASHNVDEIKPFCTNAVFGQPIEGSARESAGQYMRSCAFELQVELIEGQN